MNSWTKLTEALSELPILEQVNDEKRQLDALKPLPQEVEGRVMQKIRLDWNYHSNAIEGNKLTRGETYSVLMYDLAAKGKTVKDHTDIKGHNKAIDFIATLVEENGDLTEVDIRNLHKIVLQEPYKSSVSTPFGKQDKVILIGEYKKMPNNVKTTTDEIHYYADPQQVPILMGELVSWYNEARKNEKIHPSVLAAFFHHKFVEIHPFDDGNGRLGRILMNLILMQKGYPPAIVKLKEREEYYSVLNQADKNEYLPLMEHIGEAVSNSLNLYLKAARGESIEEDTDIDKEIALFKQGLNKKLTAKTNNILVWILKNNFYNLTLSIAEKLSTFDELFNKKRIIYQFSSEEKIHQIGDFPLDTIEVYLEQTKADTLIFIYLLEEFNRKKNSFLFPISIEIDFKDKFKYDIVQIKFVNDTKFKTILLSKHYDEPLSDFEKKVIIDKLFKNSFIDLKKKIEENTPPQ